MTTDVFDDRACVLGEGPLWHPERQQLFWFDIMAGHLLTKVDGEAQSWAFDELVSAAGWIDHDRLLIASETALYSFDLTTEEQEYIQPLEIGNTVTRSNDGRADPWGGFWIGTMGKCASRCTRTQAGPTARRTSISTCAPKTSTQTAL